MVTLVKTTIHTVRTAGIPIRRLERSKKERKNIKYKGSIVVLKGRVRRHSQCRECRVCSAFSVECRVHWPLHLQAHDCKFAVQRQSSPSSDVASSDRGPWTPHDRAQRISQFQGRRTGARATDCRPHTPDATHRHAHRMPVTDVRVGSHTVDIDVSCNTISRYRRQRE
jgi:hypothetical protein